jgi:hypothetical protein
MPPSSHPLQVQRILWNAGRNRPPKERLPVYQLSRMRLRISRQIPVGLNGLVRLGLGRANCSKGIVQDPGHPQQLVEKAVQVYLLNARTDLGCLLYLMAAKLLRTRHLLGFKRNRLAERKEARPTTLAYFAVHFAVISSRTNLTGCVTKSLFISIWRPGHAHHLEGLWCWSQPVEPIVPIATNSIHLWSTWSNTTTDPVSNKCVLFGERIISFNICGFSTVSMLYH